MILAAMLLCLVVAVNSAYAAAALSAARRYGVELSLCRGGASIVLVAGTAAECAVAAPIHGASVHAMVVAGFGSVIIGAACDAACGYVFDAVTLPALALMLVLAVVFQTVEAFAFGVLAAGGSMGTLFAITKGRGLGLGDVKLAACIGGVAGALGGVEALGVAFVLGGVYAAFLLITKRARFGTELRFAPYLAAGLAIIMLAGASS